jgi:filamentous hemagglutinin family protein
MQKVSKNQPVPRLSVLAVAACFGGAAWANPTNPTVVHGTATFQQAGSILNVTNSHNAIINWGSFSINAGELTRFIQPSALSAVLNRVTGQDPSAILGALESNGRVFLINPNGIVFGAGAQINVAGLVASTLNLSNDDFLNNRMRFTDGALGSSVVNQGSLTGGSVYLVGNAVRNEGAITTTPGGEVVLAAGNSVELVNPGTPNLRVEIVAPDNEARNLGTITAEAGRIGIYAGLIHNAGTLNASSAVAEGGRILLKAGKRVTLTSESVIDASGVGGGRIAVLAGDTVNIGGRLDASAPVSGNGGFVETSAQKVNIERSAFVTTLAAQGNTGTWLIDPTDYVIAGDGSGDASGSDVAGWLASSSVVIATDPVDGQDILVNDAIPDWDSEHTLTLTAKRNVVVNAGISNSGSGGLNLYAGWNGSSGPATPTLVPSVGNVIVNAPISVGSAVNMAAGNGIQINDSVQVSGRGGINGGGSASITLTGQSVLINGEVSAVGEHGLGYAIAGGNANITISAGTGGVTVASGSGLAAYGGSGDFGGAGGNAEIQVTSAGNVSVYDHVEARGGSGGYFSDGGNASIQLTSLGGSINVIDAGAIDARGGYGVNGGSAQAKLNAAQGIQIQAIQIETTHVTAEGGEGETGGGARVELVNTGASSTITISNGAEVGAYGGDGAEGGTGGSALTTLISAGDIVLSHNAVAVASGGDTDYYSFSGAGGSGTLSMFANGNVQMIEGANGSALGGTGFTGGSGAVLVVAGGNIDLSNALGLYSAPGYGPSSDTASTVVSAGGDLNLINVYSIGSHGVVGLGGNNILVSGSNVSGSTGLSISALGNLSVTNQSFMTGGSGNAFVNTGGNVLVDQSTIFGSPDVFLSVGGFISINGIVNYPGRIEADSSATINIDFTSTSGGFAVNGIDGLVFDPATNTGFFVNGAGASIGNGLNIVYSGTPSSTSTLNIPTENLLVAMGTSTKPPDPKNDKDVFEDIKDEKKKDAPVCR